ncbi:MAG: hypothetical protein KDA05_10445 [Phycisphaerales bacterium]|nr:hypothetical protein [Phycisphaerales bacterium]MCB9841012.1 hypothetical protein [Phycisphaeraceae bacterium]
MRTTFPIAQSACCAGVGLVGALGVPCHAVDALVIVSHNKGHTNTVVPGEPVSIEVWLTWTPGNQFAGLRGDTRATADLGAISDLRSPYVHPVFPAAYTRIGDPQGGSVVDTDIAVVPSYFTAAPLPISLLWNHMTLIEYTWTAPAVTTPIEVAFGFEAYAIAPNARFYNSPASPGWVEGNTTYIGTSLTVLPAPSALGAFLLAAGLAVRRRR